jgi:hypothetical protein
MPTATMPRYRHGRSRLLLLLISLLPLEEQEALAENLQGGFPEGAKQRIEVKPV